MTTLLIGGDSAIGTAYLQQAGNAAATSRKHSGGMIHLDLAEPFPELPKSDIAFLCAGMTRLQDCESDPYMAEKINAERSFALAKQLHDAGSFVVYFSTNQVFDGSKPQRRADEPTCPVNHYGKSKAAGEKLILSLKNAAVLRITKVITPPLPLLATWRDRLRHDETVEAFGDLFIAPVPMRQVVQAMRQLATNPKPGVHHLSGPRDVAYAEIAGALARQMGKPESLVHASSARAANLPANFTPRHTSLAPSGLDIDVPDALDAEFLA